MRLLNWQASLVALLLFSVLLSGTIGKKKGSKEVEPEGNFALDSAQRANKRSKCGPCSRNITGSASGNITSPGFPGPYKNDCFCEYAITLPGNGGQVALTFAMANLSFQGQGLQDFVLMFNGNSCQSSRIAVAFKPTNETIVTSKSQMVALFISTGGNSNGSFAANYTTVTKKEYTRPKDPFPGNWILTACGGEVPLRRDGGSVGFSGFGATDTFCIYHLVASSGLRAKLTVTQQKFSSPRSWTRLLDGSGCGSTELYFGSGGDDFSNSLYVETTGSTATWVVYSADGSSQDRVDVFYSLFS